MVFRNFENILAIRLDTGDDIHTSIINACNEVGISSGIVQGLGATSYADIHAGDEERGTFGTSVHEGKMELVSLNGNVTSLNGNLTAHLHAVLAGPKGLTVYAGHLGHGTVLNTAEVFVIKLNGTITKKPVGEWYFWDL